MIGTDSSNRRPRVLIVDDHVLFAESLELSLNMEGYDVRRVPAATMTPNQLLASVSRYQPRVVLLDLDLGELGDGVRLITPIARTGSNVVVLTASTDKSRWGDCVRQGARKAIPKTQPLNEILAVVRKICQGLPVMDAAEREQLIGLWSEQRQQEHELRERLERLTPREREVLGQLIAGHPVREIARTSVVSEATVRTQVKAILAKLEVTSQLAAVGLARQAGWSPPSKDGLVS
ncbi:response regulator transcription factor [Nocardioides sp. YIM 152588]|uniref:response regulator transcription factor n=1 Tax=Nocardioides sp. YIM 152588 TaxID=3158259 RepID=UPI0032E410DA